MKHRTIEFLFFYYNIIVSNYYKHKKCKVDIVNNWNALFEIGEKCSNKVTFFKLLNNKAGILNYK